VGGIPGPEVDLTALQLEVTTSVLDAIVAVDGNSRWGRPLGTVTAVARLAQCRGSAGGRLAGNAGPSPGC
jgi:hypothetical protein